MTKSDTITKIATALAAAQASIGAAPKNADNPFFKSRYADLGSVMAVCKEPLLAHGISVIQGVDWDGESTTLETMLLHSSGEFLASRMKVEPAITMVFPKKEKGETFTPYITPNPQALKSAITYARRAMIESMVMIPAVDDDASWMTSAASYKPTEEEMEAALKQAVTARGGEIIEPIVSPWTRWQDVVCHIGDPKGPMLGRKLGELPVQVLKWLREKWIAGRTHFPDPKDHALAMALTELEVSSLISIAEGADKAPETPAVTSEEPKAPEHPLAEETPKKRAPRKKGGDSPSQQEPSTHTLTQSSAPETVPPASGASTPMAWRSVILHIGKPENPLVGKTLEEITKTGYPAKNLDGLACLRTLATAGISKIAESDAVKDRILCNAIRAAVDELKPFDDADWIDSLDEAKAREELSRRFDTLKMEPHEVTKAMQGAKVFQYGDTLDNVKREMLLYILTHWQAVTEALK